MKGMECIGSFSDFCNFLELGIIAAHIASSQEDSMDFQVKVNLAVS